MQRLQQVIRNCLLAFTLIFLIIVKASAFSGPGHMIVAAMAYHDLTPEQREQAARILSYHIEYARWCAEADTGSLDRGLVVFMGASKWPDEIKRTSNPWNHEPWHYVDHPVTPPDFVFRESPYPGNDIMAGISKAIEGLKNESVTMEDKACWLCLLIHFIGDLHQPLHCCALVNEEFSAPDGDRGGNLIFVRASESAKGIPLHTMWDVSMGSSRGFHANYLRGYDNNAKVLRTNFKRADIDVLGKNVRVEQWAREGWQIAVDDVYLRGKLPYSRSPVGAAVLPSDYTKRLKSIATLQVAKASYRLADLIRACLAGTKH